MNARPEVCRQLDDASKPLDLPPAGQKARSPPRAKAAGHLVRCLAWILVIGVDYVHNSTSR
jgi:hypothetical protein